MLKKELGLLLLILAVGTVAGIINPQFLSQVNLMNLANQIGLFGLISIGVGIVIITGGIELSVGSVLALLGIVFLDMLINYEVAWPLALAATVLGGMAIGAIHGSLVTRLRMQPFVVTLCGLLLYRGIARWYTADSTQGFGYGGGYETLGWVMSARNYNISHTFVFFLIVAVVMGVVLHRSVYGRYLFAVGKNEEAARYSGIATDRIVASAYVICGGLAAIAAIYIAMYTRSISPASHGNFYELYAIAAAVLGGCSLRGGEGSIMGVVL